MGVNMAGHCIFDDKAVCAAAQQEIIRRYYTAMCSLRQGNVEKDVTLKLELLMKQAGVSADQRPVIGAALKKADETGEPAAAIEMPDGTIITGKTSALLGASSAAILNALKYLGGLEDDIHLISPTIIEPIQALKVQHLGNINPRLHIDEVLLALSICAATDELAQKALDQLHNLKGCEAHTTVILASTDEKMFKKLGMNITCEPTYQSKKLYHL